MVERASTTARDFQHLPATLRLVLSLPLPESVTAKGATWVEVIDQATMLIADSKFLEAIPRLIQALAVVDQLQEEVDHGDLLQCHFLLGSCYVQTGDLRSAAASFQRCIALCGDEPKNSLIQINALIQLANVFNSLGQKKAAFQLHERGLELIDTLACGNVAAKLLSARLKPPFLVKLIEESLDLDRTGDTERFALLLINQLPPGLARGVTLSVLSTTYYRLRHQGKALACAEVCATQAIQELKSHGGDSEERTSLINAYRVLGSIRLIQKRFDEAEIPHLAACNLAEQEFGELHYFCAICRCDLAFVYSRLDRPYHALQILAPNLEQLTSFPAEEESAADNILYYQPYLQLRAYLLQKIGEKLTELLDVYTKPPYRTPLQQHLKLVLREWNQSDLWPVIDRLALTTDGSPEKLLQGLQEQSTWYLHEAGQKLEQLATFYRIEYGDDYPKLATVYDQLSNVYSWLKDLSRSFMCAQHAEDIRRRNEEGPDEEL
jgi:tetratricopeptide (TPR) repeat protein